MGDINIKLVELTRALSDYKDADFYMTGSRYFGNVHDESDYDYIVQDGEEVREFLRSLGFVIQVLPHYNDTNTLAVYSCQYGKKSWEKIDVQCCENVQNKIKAQQVIRGTFPKGLPKDKSISKGIWEPAIRLIDSLIVIQTPPSPKRTLEDRVNDLKKAWKK